MQFEKWTVIIFVQCMAFIQNKKLFICRSQFFSTKAIFSLILIMPVLFVETNLLHVERLQRRACRVILNYNVDNIHQSMNYLKIMPLSERIFLRKAKFMFKISNNIMLDYINAMFSKRE